MHVVVSFQIISTRRFSQSCCAITSFCCFNISLIFFSIQPNLFDTFSSSSDSSDSASCSLPFPLPFALLLVFFLRFTRSDPSSVIPHRFLIVIHLSHEVLLP